MNELNWRKSSHSTATSGNCVEVSTDGAVLVRDTTNRAGAVLNISPSAWNAFLAAIR
jgi:hypothetical protein